MPEIDLSRYQCKAVIDKIEFCFTCSKPTQFRYIQTQLGRLLPRPNGKQHWVKKTPGGTSSATEFKITLQDPEASTLLKVEEMLRDRFAMIGSTKVLEFEVSIDFYPRNESDIDRARMVAVLQRHYQPQFDLFKITDSHPRFVIDSETEPGKSELIYSVPWHKSYQTKMKNVAASPEAWLAPEATRQPPIDKILYMGAKNGDELIRIQNKVTNNRTDKSAEVLQQNKKRARIEIRLRGNALIKHGIRSLGDITVFQFGNLQKDYFHFALPSFLTKPDDPKLNAILEYTNRRELEFFCRVGLPGLQQVQIIHQDWRKTPIKSISSRSHIQLLNDNLKRQNLEKKRDRRGNGARGTTVAYNELNDKVREALRGMTKRAARDMSKAGK